MFFTRHIYCLNIQFPLGSPLLATCKTEEWLHIFASCGGFSRLLYWIFSVGKAWFSFPNELIWAVVSRNYSFVSIVCFVLMITIQQWSFRLNGESVFTMVSQFSLLIQSGYGKSGCPESCNISDYLNVSDMRVSALSFLVFRIVFSGLVS